MIKFSHIGQLHNVVRTVEARRAAGEDIAKVAYRGTVKLHGSNASLVCTPAAMQPQSRNREIALEDDNLGFAAFALAPERRAGMRALEAQLREASGIGDEAPLAIFGEWVGPGVQKGAAVTRLSGRQWVLFALASVELDPEAGELRKRWFELPPLGDRFVELGVHTINDGPTWELELDFGERVAIELAADAIDEITASIDARCPWAGRFGVEGAGEGLVWEPRGRHFGDSDLRFKSKGESHRVLGRGDKRRKSVAVDPAVLVSVEAFVEHTVTLARLEQGFEVLREQGLELEMRSLGAYLRWLATDLRRECADELEANALSWKQVARAVNERAKTHFRKRLMA